MQRYKNLAVLLIVLLIVIAGGTVLFRKYFDGNYHERVKLSQVDLSKAEPNEKIPANFPKDIPVELTDITESYDMEYPARGVIISGITFNTARPPFEIFNFYKQTLIQLGYAIDDSSTNQDRGILYAKKGGDVLAMAINSVNPTDGKVTVRLVNTAKK
jgi:hypothetical protein